jgi:hypothetical protein
MVEQTNSTHRELLDRDSYLVFVVSEIQCARFGCIYLKLWSAKVLARELCTPGMGSQAGTQQRKRSP